MENLITYQHTILEKRFQSLKVWTKDQRKLIRFTRRYGKKFYVFKLYMYSKLDSDSTLFHDGEDDPPRADIIDDNLTSSNKKLANTLKSNLESYCNDCYFVKCNNYGATFG